jgi:hypothetical protein
MIARVLAAQWAPATVDRIWRLGFASPLLLIAVLMRSGTALRRFQLTMRSFSRACCR